MQCTQTTSTSNNILLSIWEPTKVKKWISSIINMLLRRFYGCWLHLMRNFHTTLSHTRLARRTKWPSWPQRVSHKPALRHWFIVDCLSIRVHGSSVKSVHVPRMNSDLNMLKNLDGNSGRGLKIGDSSYSVSLYFFLVINFPLVIHHNSWKYVMYRDTSHVFMNYDGWLEV